MPLFERSRVPLDVFSSEALDQLDQLVDGLREQQVALLVVPELTTGFRVPGMIRALSQSYVRRCIELADASALLCHTQHWLGAIVVARSLLETIAASRHVVSKLDELVESEDIEAVHDFVHGASFSTRLPQLINKVDSKLITATNILTQIEKMKSDSEEIKDDYDHLCEYSHPNSIGTFLFFGHHDPATDRVSFRNQGWRPNDAFIWIGSVCSMLWVVHRATEQAENLARRTIEIEERLSRPNRS